MEGGMEEGKEREREGDTHTDLVLESNSFHTKANFK